MIVRANAACLPLRPSSVDLVVTSPPYWSFRSYRDGEDHLVGQVGDESEPHGFLRNLWAVMDALWAVTKPGASVFINLGDKSAGSGGHNNSGVVGHSSIFKDRNRAIVDARNTAVSRRDSPDRYLQAAYVQDKSLMLLPHAFILGCIAPELYRNVFDPPTEDWWNMRIIEHPQWICRAEIIWNKPNGMPESAADRVRRSHEHWFHLTKQRRYFYATDEIAEPYKESSLDRTRFAANAMGASRATMDHWGRDSFAGPEGAPWEPSPLGKLPGSVWDIPTAPLTIPEAVRERYSLPKHHAPFPIEWPRRLILGWSPSGICLECGTGRHRRRGRVCEQCGEVRPHQSKACPECGYVRDWKENRRALEEMNADWSLTGHGTPRVLGGHVNSSVLTELVCDCDEPTAPTRPAVVLDPFGGTGTTAMVARSLGRIGLNLDLSMDYCRLAKWRVFQSGEGAKVQSRTDAARQGAFEL